MIAAMILIAIDAARRVNRVASAKGSIYTATSWSEGSVDKASFTRLGKNGLSVSPRAFWPVLCLHPMRGFSGIPSGVLSPSAIRSLFSVGRK